MVAGVVDGNEVAIGPDMLSDLDGLVGEDIICSDGSTLLGGDDKAGVAEIMALVARIHEDPPSRIRAWASAFALTRKSAMVPRFWTSPRLDAPTATPLTAAP